MAVDYGEDFLQRIVAVHWHEPEAQTGGVFVAGDGDGNVHYLRIGPRATKDELGKLAWRNLGQLDFGGTVYGSSHAIVDRGANKEPVFVLVGGTGGTSGVGVIMASADGLNWQKVYTQLQEGGPVSADRCTGATVWAVVWDETAKSFFAAGHQSFNAYRDPADIANDPRLFECDILLQSFDGHHWSEIQRFNNVWDSSVSGTTWPPYPTGLLDAHCSKRVTDSNNNGISDGFYKYDSTDKRMIAPAGTFEMEYLFGSASCNPTDSVTVTNLGVGTTKSSSTGFPTYCVAQAGGQWMAAGGTYDNPIGVCQASILVPSSEEGGIGWKPLNPSGNKAIGIMTGGQAKPPPA